MNDIPFEKVALEEARAILDSTIVPANADCTAAAPPPSAASETPPRTGSEQHALCADAFAWLSQLPRDKRPLQLARQFPRIANQLALLWQQPLRCELYLDGLVIDLRGGRRGFPPPVDAEIRTLRTFYTEEVAPVRFDVWGGRIGLCPE
jgi:hypothetical protein